MGWGRLVMIISAGKLAIAGTVCRGRPVVMAWNGVALTTPAMPAGIDQTANRNRFNGMMYLYPGKAGGVSIDVEITLEARVMEKLEKSKEFLLIDEEEDGNKITNGNGHGHANGNGFA